MLLILIVDLVMLAVTLQVSGVCFYAERSPLRLMNFSGWEILTLTLPAINSGHLLDRRAPPMHQFCEQSFRTGEPTLTASILRTIRTGEPTLNESYSRYPARHSLPQPGWLPASRQPSTPEGT